MNYVYRKICIYVTYVTESHINMITYYKICKIRLKTTIYILEKAAKMYVTRFHYFHRTGASITHNYALTCVVGTQKRNFVFKCRIFGKKIFLRFWLYH